VGQGERAGVLLVLVAALLRAPGGDLVEVGLFVPGEARGVVLRGCGDGEQVDAGQRLRVGLTQTRGDPRAQVSAVGGIPVEAELVPHEPVPYLVSLERRREGQALRRECVAGQRGDDDRERVGRVAAVLRRLRETPGEVGELQEGAGPPVGQDDRQGAGLLAVEPEVMDGRAADGGRVVRQGVDPRLVGAPVIACGPVLRQAAHLSGVGARFPAIDGPPGGPPGGA
jgi:hypothetical protein